MKEDAVIIGYSGHAYVVADILLKRKYNIIGYCEKAVRPINPFDLTYLGDETGIEVILKLRRFKAFLGIGDNQIRSKVYQNLIENNVEQPLLRHPKSIVSKMSEIGFGTVVMPGAVVNALSKIGAGVILNTACVIEHECLIDNFVHIGPGATLAGNVSVGEKTFIGASTVIRQNIKIGSNVVIGAGSVIVKDVPDGVTVFGNPGRIK
jgi:sugar O-acyltransferase (sialic acid O-acetyltransferase NeuD family)